MPKPRLTGDEIREALRINSPSLVEEIHAIALRQNLTEDARETRLDGKAQGLLVTAGLSLTVAFTFGGILLQHPEYLKPLGNGLADTVLVLFALALVFGLLASVFAVLAQFVTGDYRSAAERDVFNLAELDAAEKAATEKTATTDQNVVDDKRAQTRYRRYMTIQYWQIWQQHFAIHERKARRIKWGQKFFLGFLVALLLIGVATAYSAFGRHEDPKSQQVQP